MGHGWFGGTPPPTYSKEDPFGKTGKKRRLKKKKKTGWFRLGDDEVDAESNTPRMTGSRSYARKSEGTIELIRRWDAAEYRGM